MYMHPLFLLVSLSSFGPSGWLQAGPWKLTIQDIDQLTRPTHPPTLSRPFYVIVLTLPLSILVLHSTSQSPNCSVIPNALVSRSFNKEILALVLRKNSLWKQKSLVGDSALDRYPRIFERNERGIVVFERHVLPMWKREIMWFLLDNVSYLYRLHWTLRVSGIDDYVIYVAFVYRYA